MIAKDAQRVIFHKDMRLTNYSGTQFDVAVERGIRLLDKEKAKKKLGIEIGVSIKMVAFQSDNKIINKGSEPWQKETGLLSIWILGMFNPSPATTIVIPFRAGEETEPGPIVNDAYFGKVPAERLVIDEGVLYFSGDGEYRSKIGLAPQRAMSVLGSYDAVNKVLTVVEYNKPAGVTDYVNSMWELQDEPYGGDVVNSYNDGPPAPGAKPMGPFYELETSSPAAALKPGEAISHVSSTFHFQGPEEGLDTIARVIFKMSLEEIKNALKR